MNALQLNQLLDECPRETRHLAQAWYQASQQIRKMSHGIDPDHIRPLGDDETVLLVERAEGLCVWQQREAMVNLFAAPHMSPPKFFIIECLKIDQQIEFHLAVQRVQDLGPDYVFRELCKSK
jgi:hypothetical protein